MNDPIYAFKGEAARLTRGLQSLGLAVSHSQALDLIGQVHGRRDWKELKALATLPAAEAHRTPPVPVELSLAYIEAQLRTQGLDEAELDELVHEYIGGQSASRINNDGMSSQLESLLAELNNKPAELVKVLEDHIEDLNLSLCSVQARVWGPNTPDVHFDALPWLLQNATPDLLERLLKSSPRGCLGNCDIGDDVAVWSSENGRTGDKQAITALREAVRAAQALDEDLVGITVSIHVLDLKAFVQSDSRFDAQDREDLVDAIEAYNRY